ncbi:MAG: lysophospholipid acyltransferase family protein [Ferrimicrobium sp.]
MARSTKGTRPLDIWLQSPRIPRDLLRDHSHPTGVEYNTDFARSQSIRRLRAVVFDTVIGPTTRTLTHPTVINAEALDGLEGPLVIVANHQSHLDTPLLLSVLPAKIRHHTIVGAGADYFFDRRTKGALSATFLGAIPIERARASRRSAELTYRLVEEGWTIILFPEGGRTPDGLPQELRAGAALVALKTQVPLVPVYIDGTYEIFGKNATRLRPGDTTVIFGRPIHPDPSTRPSQLIAQVDEQFARLAQEVTSDWWSARSSKHAPSFTPANRDWIEAWNHSAHRHRPPSARPWPQIFGSSRAINR